MLIWAPKSAPCWGHVGHKHSLEVTLKTKLKKDLQKGDKIDGIGGFSSYGVTYPVAEAENLVPLGLLEGAVIAEDIKQGEPISFDSVELPENLINNLRKLQEDS